MTNTDESPTIEHYGNGVIVRGKGGRFLPGTKSPAPITVQNTHEFARIRQERKRQVIAAAANAAVERQDWRNQYGDEAWIAALADTAYTKATTPEDPKAVDAARFLLQETGLAEQRGAERQLEDSDERTILHELARRIRAMAERGAFDEEPEK